MIETLVTTFLLLLNLSFVLLIMFQRRRRPLEPPLVKHAMPFVGGSFQFGRQPLEYLLDHQKRYGDVFTIELAGWTTHMFMNPLDVRSLEKCNNLDHREIVGDFVTRMVGSDHCIHNDPDTQAKVKCQSEAARNRAKSPEREIRRTERAPDVNRMAHSIVKNLRGSMQLGDLCSSAKHVVACALERNLARVQPGKHGDKKSVELYDFCKRIIFDITFNLFFGSLPDIEESAQETERFYEVFKRYFKDSSKLVARVPVYFLPDVKVALNQLVEMIGAINWAERTNVSQLVADIVNMNPTIDFSSRRSRHLVMILWAAQANTAPALFWTLYQLLKSPDAIEDVMSEYRNVIGLSERPRSGSMANHLEYLCKKPNHACKCIRNILGIRKKDLDKTVVLEGCIKETMRMTGASFSIRKATADTVVPTQSGKSFKIRKGDYTAFYAPVIHMDEQIFDDPREYQHERFVTTEPYRIIPTPFKRRPTLAEIGKQKHLCSGLTRMRSKFFKSSKRIPASKAILTFGLGASQCPGRHIAIIEIKLVVLSLLQHCQIDFVEPDAPTPGEDKTHLGFGVMPPSDDVRVTMRTCQDINNNVASALELLRARLLGA